MRIVRYFLRRVDVTPYPCRQFSTPGGRGAALLDKIGVPQLNPPTVDAKVTEFSPSQELTENCGVVEEEVIEMEDMFVKTTMGLEWGGPMRGGRYSEPTRFGDWEQKGRCTDF
mmetsp:Transcript_89231/g.178336  ORF Transcript_89231/g.178336 Transcript_89231/m.178336 type:complete len:113 (+) Transcript_89231:140-478(+)